MARCSATVLRPWIPAGRVVHDGSVTAALEHPPAHESPSGHSGRKSWTSWVVAVAALAGLAAIGGWLIGLAPAYAGGLIAALVGVSAAWMLVAHRRGRVGSPVVAIGRVAVTGVALLLAIQVLPIGRDHSNPTVTGEPAWSSPRTRELMVAACYSCHSNEVEWPWYSNIAPMSWAISDHVEEGREAVNFSQFATNRGEADESIEEILDGSMPPAYFTRFGLHPDAVLSADDQAELIAGLRATPGFDDESDESEEEDEEEEEEDDDDD